MTVLFRNATLIYPGHKLNNKKLNFLIDNGIIKKISSENIVVEDHAEIIESNNLCVSPGWLDLRADFAEPGYEEKETLESGTKAAAAGGFTGVCVTPSTYPIIDTRAGIEYIKKASGSNGVSLYPLGALSKGMNGQDLAELYDMKLAGAVAFTDYKNSLANAKFVQLALDYSSGIDSLIMTFSQEKNLTGKAQVNEGEKSTYLGLKGIPHLAEEVIINRDIYLTEYTGGSIHFSGISSAKSVDLITEAKAKGVKVTCDVDLMHLLESDAVLDQFDSNYKVLPPLRTESDRQKLISGLNNGTIDAICSDHSPHNIENKDCEFEIAHYGSNTIQSTFALLNTKLSNEISTETLVEKLAINPRKLLRMDNIEVEENKAANLTFFDPNIEWNYNSKNNYSKSENSPYLNSNLKGKVIAICNENQIVVNE